MKTLRVFSRIALLAVLFAVIVVENSQSVAGEVPQCADSSKRQVVKLTVLDRTGDQFDGCTGDVSAYSDVYREHGIRVSPGNSPGTVWYDFDTRGSSPRTVEFTWTDNAWVDGAKAALMYNWESSSFDTVYTWHGKDGKEHVTNVDIDESTYIGNDGLFRVGFYGAPMSVIHLRRIRLL
ncbi:MAG: hypothetical protein NT025_06025 [bacterium]|nr:hypothetical protein [bacterium]